MKEDKKLNEKEKFDITKVKFKPITVFFQIFLQNYFLHQHFYIEKRKSREEYLEWNENFTNEMIEKLTAQKRRLISQEEMETIKQLNISAFPRISDEIFSSIKNRVHFVFNYSEAEHCFFKSLRFLMIKNSLTEKEAEKQTMEVIMKNSWYKIFDIFKNMFKINYTINSKLIQELQNYKFIRNVFVHGNGTVTQRFLRKFPSSNLSVGDTYILETENIFYYSGVLFDIISPFDEILLKNHPEIKFRK